VLKDEPALGVFEPNEKQEVSVVGCPGPEFVMRHGVPEHAVNTIATHCPDVTVTGVPRRSVLNEFGVKVTGSRSATVNDCPLEMAAQVPEPGEHEYVILVGFAIAVVRTTMFPGEIVATQTPTETRDPANGA